MARIITLTLIMTLSSGAFAASAELQTMTGWFADARCAGPRVAKGIIAPNNSDCVKRCLDEGATPVFISEQAKAMFEVKEYPSVVADLGYHVEVTGTIDKAGKVIAVKSAKRLSAVGNFCVLAPKGSREKK